MADGEDPVQLMSCDGQSFRVKARVARLSETAKNRLEDFGMTVWRGIHADECTPYATSSDGVVTHVLLKNDITRTARRVRPLAENETVEKETRRVRTVDSRVTRAPAVAGTGAWYATEEPDDIIALPEVAGRELARVVQWMVHHDENPTPPVSEEDESRTDNIVEWDRALLDGLDKVHDEDIDLLAAANYMHIPELVATLQKYGADICKGKTPAEIYAMRGETVESMKEHEEAVKKEEGPWVERYYTGEPVPVVVPTEPKVEPLAGEEAPKGDEDGAAQMEVD